MGFDAGALLFKIQAVGKALFVSDMRDSQTAIDGVEQASKKAKGSAEGLGKSQDEVAEKAKKTKAPLDEQAKSTKSTGDESETAAKKQREQAAAAEKQRSAAVTLAAGLVAVGLAASAMVGLSVAKFTEFDKQMSNTSAATMATAEEQRALGAAALDAGADTAYSATEAAAAEEELAKAGQSVADITGGSLKGSLALAAAGQLEVARSAEIMATVLTQFQLPARDAARVSDVLAAGAGKAQGSVDDLSLALSYVGPLAKSMGWSLEETAGTIAYFSTQGIAGEKAGTSLRGVLAALQAPSKAAADVMQQYGINVYDANGRMLAAAPLAEQLRTKLGSLTDQERQAALGRIFGNESLLAATLLYGGGAAAVSKWTKEVTDAGYAADQAAQRQDNLAGDIEKLGGAFDTALIKTGSSANDVLRMMVQNVTALVDMYGEAPEPIQATALVLGVGVAALALFSGGAVIARVKFIELKAALDLANVSMGRTAIVGGAVGIALTGLAVIIAMVAQAQAEARARATAYADALAQGEDATKKFIAEQLAMKDSFLWLDRGSAIENARKLGFTIDDVTAAVTGSADEFERFKERVQDAYDTRGQGVEFGIAAQQLREKVQQLRDAQVEGAQASLDAKNAQESLTGETANGVPVTKDAADAYMDAADNAGKLEDQLQQLIDTIMEANGIGQDAVSANIDYQNALAAVDETIQKARDGADGYALTLDTATQAGRDNKDLLVELAQSAQDAAEKQFKLDGNTSAYRKSLEDGRNALIQRATDLGMNADEVQALADQIFRIPSETEWKVLANTAFAQQQVDSYISRNTGREIIVKISGVPVAQGLGGSGGITQADGGVVSYYANGGTRYENHVAQIARAGSYRVWAEPETGGESYMPHALAKRARAEQVMTETASIFGGVYIPAADVQAMRASSPSSTGGNTYNVTQNIRTEQTDPRVQAREWGREFRRAVAGA